MSWGRCLFPTENLRSRTRVELSLSLSLSLSRGAAPFSGPVFHDAHFEVYAALQLEDKQLKMFTTELSARSACWCRVFLRLRVGGMTMKGCPYVDPVTTLVASTPEVLLQGSLVALGGVHREGKGRRFSLRTAWTYFQEVTRRCFRGLRGKGSARRLCAISRSLSTATYLRTYRGMHKVTKYCVAIFFFSFMQSCAFCLPAFSACFPQAPETPPSFGTAAA